MCASCKRHLKHSSPRTISIACGILAITQMRSPSRKARGSRSAWRLDKEMRKRMQQHVRPTREQALALPVLPSVLVSSHERIEALLHGGSRQPILHCFRPLAGRTTPHRGSRPPGTTSDREQSATTSGVWMDWKSQNGRICAEMVQREPPGASHRFCVFAEHGVHNHAGKDWATRNAGPPWDRLCWRGAREYSKRPARPA